MLVSFVMESLLLLLSALDVDGEELPRQQLALAASPVTNELVSRSEDGLHRMSSPGNVESSELESLKLSSSRRNKQWNRKLALASQKHNDNSTLTPLYKEHCSSSPVSHIMQKCRQTPTYHLNDHFPGKTVLASFHLAYPQDFQNPVLVISRHLHEFLFLHTSLKLSASAYIFPLFLFWHIFNTDIIHK